MAELVARSLRRQIVQGDLSEGDPLPPESELMRQFGVSRPTLREAFRVLESENLIIIRRGARGGARVLAPSADVAARYAALLLQFRGATLVDVYRAREIIEPPMVRLLAEKRTQAQLKDVRARLEADARAGTGEPHPVDAKTSIHRMLIKWRATRRSPSWPQCSTRSSSRRR
jgi:DNA-binding FadR family transcriptional regulator